MNQIRTAAPNPGAVRPGAVDDLSRVPGSRSGINSECETLEAPAINKFDVLAALNIECRKPGGQSAFARRAGVSEAYISQVVNGQKSPSPSILRALGFRKTIVEIYERIV